MISCPRSSWTAATNSVTPLCIVQVPLDSKAHAALKALLRVPAELAADLVAVDGVTAVVTKTVLYVGDQGAIQGFKQKTVQIAAVFGAHQAFLEPGRQ